jgi:2-polyprenyl-6-methoxyphenol hydroxylase-like FAD-dependent oxidoreductase
MNGVDRVLIVGGGIAGTTLAIGLRALGIGVEIAEREQEWRPLGVGLTLQGPALRALGALGVLDAVVAAGVGVSELRIGTANSEIVESVRMPSLAGPGYPASVSLLRPAFHDVLAGIARRRQAIVRLGTTVAALAQDDAGVDVTFGDGSHARYGLIVGADGLHSRVRQLVLDDGGPAPHFTRQAVWRAMLPRHQEVADALVMFYGPRNKVGFNPVSDDQMYIFVVENVDDRTRPSADALPRLLRAELDAYTGWVADVADELAAPEHVDRRLIDTLLVPDPWHRGRVVLIGDAAHTPGPHLASGAGIAIEDAAVLSELLGQEGPVEEVLARFMARRYERCRMVVENSRRLGEWERRPGDPDADPVRLTSSSLATLAQPI